MYILILCTPYKLSPLCIIFFISQKKLTPNRETRTRLKQIQDKASWESQKLIFIAVRKNTTTACPSEPTNSRQFLADMVCLLFSPSNGMHCVSSILGNPYQVTIYTPLNCYPTPKILFAQNLILAGIVNCVMLYT